MKKRLLTYCFICMALNGLAQPFFQSRGLESATVGYAVCDIETGEVVAQRNAALCLTPASVTKVVTTATALNLLGGDFRFETLVEYDGTLSDGVLDGNLYVKGGGDPTLGSYRMGDPKFLDRWVDLICAKGVRRINGGVVADASLFDSEGLPPKWIWEDIGNYYAAGVYALSVYDNTCRVTLRSGKAGTVPEILEMKPEMPGFRIENHLVVKDIKSDSAYFYGAPFEQVRYLYGAVPVAKKAFIIKGDIPYPPLFLVSELTRKLRKKGVSVGKEPSVLFDASRGSSRTLLHKHVSQPLAAIVREINHQSNNFYAEHLLKFLALQKNAKGTLNGALGVVKSHWEEKGLNTASLFMHDGSGLSPMNAITPFFLTAVLRKMKEGGEYRNFYRSLPVAGESGTVRSFLMGTALAGTVRAKSGSFEQVQCYAGYLSDKYAFAVMVNNFYCPRRVVRQEMEAFLQWAVRQ